MSSGRPSVAGLPAVQELDEKITPLAAVAVVRALDADGHWFIDDDPPALAAFRAAVKEYR